MKPLNKIGLDCNKCPPNKGHNRKHSYLWKKENITHKDKRHRPPKHEK